MFDRWDEPVRVKISGVTHLVFDDTRAAEMLLMQWPVRSGEHYRVAQAAVSRSMKCRNGLQASDESRAAFAAAAREAGILLGPGHGASNQIGYHLIGDDGSETFTTNRGLAKTLQAQGWLAVGFVALPVAATDAMIDAGENEFFRLLGRAPNPLPQDGVFRVLRAALTPLNGAL